MVAAPPITVDLITRNFKTANRTASNIRWIVIHDMEMAEKSDTAEGCRDYFQANTKQTSAHYTLDDNSIVQCVRLKDIAWCALYTANQWGIHLEHAGFARQTSGQWLDVFGVSMLNLSARLVSWLCDLYDIPKRRLTIAEIKAGKRGIVGHGDLTAAGIDGNSHTDPGPNFPWAWYLARVNDPTLTEKEDTMSAADVAELKDYIGRLLVAGYVTGSTSHDGIAEVAEENRATLAAVVDKQAQLEALVVALAEKQLTPDEVQAALEKAVENAVEVRGNIEIVPKGVMPTDPPVAATGAAP